MSLTHTPAHSENHPDRFTHEESGLGYSVFQDINAEDPRTNIEDEHAALWAYGEPRQSSSVAGTLPDNVAIKAFAHYFEYVNDKKSLQLARRYLAVFHPEKKITVDIATIRGYSQSDWLDVVCAVSEGYGKPEEHINEFRMWAYGDVWTVVPDTKPGICGIYADTSEEALKQFQEEHEDRPIWETVSADDATGAAESAASKLVTTEALIEAARLLQSDNGTSGEATEYDRALVELIGNVLGHNQLLADDRAAAETMVLGRTIDLPKPLMATEERDTDFSVTWAVDSDSSTALDAVLNTWQYSFGRGYARPRPDDACVFTVTDRNTGASTVINLADDAYAHHFPLR